MAIRGNIFVDRYKVNCEYHRIYRGEYLHSGKVVIALHSFIDKDHAGQNPEPFDIKNFEVKLEDMPQRVDFRESLYAYILGLESFVDFEIVLEEGQVLEQPIERWSPPVEE